MRFPLVGRLSGNGWELLFSTTAFDPYDQIALSAFRVSRPLPHPCAEGTLGYIPYSPIPRPADDQLVDAPTESGRFAFASLYQGEKTEKAGLDGTILYGKTVVRARARVKIKRLFSNPCLVFVTGQILGTTLGRGQGGFANLREGENLIELSMLPSARDEYRFGPPRIVWASRPTALAVPQADISGTTNGARYSRFRNRFAAPASGPVNCSFATSNSSSGLSLIWTSASLSP